ncbi:transmembrane protein 18 [Selaginella moellendorffii]|nr:transmembrane protein 18 [Selaginella moellendorffii]|eukprot:XP_002986406.2 transmembrane protein 18 [Selaginella moellendorffii]
MEEERGGAVAEAAAAAMASIDGMAGMVEDLSIELRRQWDYVASAPDGALLGPVFSFLRAVDWMEPWLLLLIIFHAGLLTVAIRTRENNNMQMLLFTFGLLSVYSAEKINTLLARNWERFSRKPYFDRDGVFVSTVWSGPLLLIGTVILVNTLRTLVKLLVKWKRAELKHRAYLARKRSS